MRKIHLIVAALSIYAYHVAGQPPISCDRASIDEYLEFHLDPCLAGVNSRFCTRLNCKGLTEVPEKLYQLTTLETLILDGTFDAIPSGIEALTNLNSLTIEETIVTLPDLRNTNLKELTIKSVSLSRIPNGFKLPSTLESLTLKGPRLSYLPNSMFLGLNELVSLDLDIQTYNKRLPASIEKLNQLDEFDLFFDGKNIPNLSGLKKLTEIKVVAPNLKEISEKFCADNLERLRVEAPIARIAPKLQKLKHLESIELYEFTKEDIPRFIFDSFPSLTYVKFEETAVDGLPQNLGMATNLEDFDFDQSYVRNMVPVTNLPNVEHITLSRNEISEIPRQIGKLESLTKLDLHENRIESIPTQIANLQALEYLELSRNPIKEIPDSMRYLLKLVSLEMDHCELESLPDSIGFMESLVSLQLNDNHIQSIPSSISNLSKLRLKVMDLSNNDIDTLPSHLSGVASLFLNNNKIQRIENIGECSFRTLEVANNELNYVDEELFTKCEDLNGIDFSGNKLSSLDVPQTDLRLDRFRLNENMFATIPLLPTTHAIELNNNQISAMSDLSENDNLFEIHLDGNDIEGALDPELFPPQLRILSLANNLVNDIKLGLDQFIPNLNVLNLRNNALEWLPSGLFTISSRLEYFNVGANSLSALPSSIAVLPFLEALDISDNNLESWPSQIDSLKLATLNISYNPMKDLSALENFETLEWLDVSGYTWGEITWPNFESMFLTKFFAKDCAMTVIPPLPKPLIEVDLSKNHLRKIPESFFNDNPLVEQVSFANNYIKNVPSKLFGPKPSHEKVDSIDLSGNSISAIPNTIVNMVSLDKLYLADNNLRRFPSALEKLPSLDVLDLRGNRIRSFSKNLLKVLLNMSINEIYLKQRVKANYPCEWKPYLRHLDATDLTEDDLDC